MSIVLQQEVIRDFGERLLQAVNVPAENARLVSHSLVAASLRGVDSHGVLLLASYLAQLEAGKMDPLTKGRVASESGACMIYDGETGVGQVIADICCRHAVRLAKDHGLGMVISRQSSHFGAAAYWAQRMSEAGMIGMVTCNAAPRVAPWQGKDARFGTNPICMSTPGKSWLLDMATTTVAMGKIYKAGLAGQSIPLGWAMDSEGVPTTSPKEATVGSLMPLGGYKGYGLAMMAEILCAVLSGGKMSTEIKGSLIHGTAMEVSQMFLAIDVSRFMPLEDFVMRMEQFVAMMKSSRPAAGYDEVLVAGDPEWRAEEVRCREGIPVSDELWLKLAAFAAKLKVPLPEV